LLETARTNSEPSTVDDVAKVSRRNVSLAEFRSNLTPSQEYIGAIAPYSGNSTVFELYIGQSALILKDDRQELCRLEISSIPLPLLRLDTNRFCLFAKVADADGSAIRKCFVMEAELVDAIDQDIQLAFQLGGYQMASKPVLQPATNADGSMDFQDRMIEKMSDERYQKLIEGLDSAPWYHGVLSCAEAESLVPEEGSFLVRKSPGDGSNPRLHPQIVLTARSNTHECAHLRLIWVDGKKVGSARVGDRKFGNVAECVQACIDDEYVFCVDDAGQSYLQLKTPIEKAG